jgi:hypothetical protein
MSDIVTTWFAVRFDPANFTVNTGDYTFVKYMTPPRRRSRLHVLVG